ncbi:hypothetical protein FSP39_014712 [Pinctada imbricata]|uniref:Poly [ADP-ribose] polymerase n=1 Tax=Pinctada imbricata TaxID=66713 RepID=A0AA88Y066_PINIB|nr:hypothetical protein FSP39_014712 [Pinctada imbricata]
MRGWTGKGEREGREGERGKGAGGGGPEGGGKGRVKRREGSGRGCANYHLTFGVNRKIGDLTLQIKPCDTPNEIPKDWLTIVQSPLYPGMQRFPGPGNQGFQSIHGNPYANQTQQEPQNPGGGQNPGQSPSQQRATGPAGPYGFPYPQGFGQFGPGYPNQGQPGFPGQRLPNPGHEHPGQGQGYPGQGQGYPGQGYPGQGQGYPGQGQFPYQGFPPPGYMNFPGHFPQQGTDLFSTPKKEEKKNDKADSSEGSGDETWSPPGENQQGKTSSEKMSKTGPSPPPSYEQSESQYGMKPGMKIPVPPHHGHAMPHATNMPPNFPYGMPHPVPTSTAHGIPHGMPHIPSGVPHEMQQMGNLAADKPSKYPQGMEVNIPPGGPNVMQQQAGPQIPTGVPQGQPNKRAKNVSSDTKKELKKGSKSNAPSKQQKQMPNIMQQPGGFKIPLEETERKDSISFGSDFEPPSVSPTPSKRQGNREHIQNIESDDKDEEDEDDGPLSIRVSNLPKGTTEESLEMFFESKKRSGGDEIETLEYDDSAMTAIVTFKDPDVVARVMSRIPLVFNKKQIKVEIFQREDDNEKTDESDDDGDDDEEEDEDDGCTIEVRGVKPSTTDDNIEMFFENKRKSGGEGEVKMKKEEEDDEIVYYVTFESKEVAERVLSKKSLKLDGAELEVKLYKPPPPPKPVPMYENRVFINGFGPATTKDSLENFLEAKAHANVLDVTYGEEEGTALVTFEAPPDFQKLEAACKKRQLDKHWLRVSKVPITCCIIVTNFKETTSEDTLEMYFDNKKRSDGGGVEKAEMKTEEGYCLIHFEDSDICDRVCKKSSHKVDGQKLNVQIYHECLGIPASDQEGIRFKLPDPVFLKQLEPRKMQFLYKSKPNKEAMELQVSKTNGKIVWPPKHSDPLKIECTLSKDVKDCNKLVKTWKNDVTDAVSKFFSVIVVDILPVLQEGWGEVKKELQTMNVSHPEGVAVILEKESKEIIIVGHKGPVLDVQSKASAIIKKVSDDLDKKKQQVTEKMPLKYHQLMYLSMQHFKEEMEKQFPDMKLEFKMKEKEIILSGLSGNVTSAKLLLLERLNAVCSSSAGVFSKQRVSFLLGNNEVKKHIAQKMKEANILSVFEVQNKEEVMTYAATDEDAVKAAHIIKGEIVESPVQVPKSSMYLLDDPKYVQKCDEIKKDYPLVTFTVMKKESSVVIVTVNENLANIREMIQDFFTFNTIFTEEMNLTPHMLKFLNIRYKRDIEKIPKDLVRLQVGVELSRQKIVIKGTRDGLTQAKQQIDNILNNIKKRRHDLKRPGIVKLIRSEQGKAKISKVEKSSRCMIMMEGDEERSGGQDQDMVRSWSGQHGGSTKLNNGEVAKHRSQSGVTILVHKGDLTSMYVDMLVNAANPELRHNGGLAKALVKKGGDSIQQECTAIVKQNGRLNEGDVVVTSSGRLKCKKIAHAVGPAWKGGNSQERESLEDCIMTSMKETDDRHFSSIAIPALCTGIFGFPVSEATLVILRAVKKYLRKKQSSGIKSIILCDVRDETVEGFCQAMKKEYGGKVTFVQQVGDKGQNGGRSNPKIERQASYQQLSEITMGKVCVKIVKGQIANQTVDVIVNTASKDLNLSQGFVSNSLLKAGGETLQEECTKNYPNGIEFGDVAVTSGGKLKCKNVLHGALPAWSQDQSVQSLEVLQTFLNNCLKEASSKKAKSIAMPAMGTGKLGYQKDVVAKSMFDAAAGVSSHKSSIKEVRFVIYEKDTETLQAFEKEIASRSSSESAYGDKPKKKGPRHGNKLEKKEEDYDHLPELDPPPSDQRVSVPMGSINMNIYQGDLTVADVDVIVNSTNSEIDLSKGAVAKSIQKLGGQELQKQVQVQKETMKKDGIAVTTNGGPSSRLAAKFIVHIDAQNDKKTWKQKIMQILQKAEEIKMNSIAMPALGTGVGGVPVAEIAKHMYEAIEKFQKETPPQHLKEVHIVIFQQQMVQSFIIAMQGCFQGAKPKGILGKAWNYLKSGGGGETEDPKWQAKVSKQPPSTSCVTLVVFGDNGQDIDKAISHLEKIIEEDYNTKLFKERIISQLSQNQIKQIKHLETKHDVEVTVDKDNNSIILNGTNENLMGAADAIHTIIREAERNKQAKQQAELVSEMVQWCFLETGTDQTTMEEYPASVNFLIETAFRNKDPVVKFKDNSGNEYTISFQNMEEYPTSTPDDKVKVLRREKLKDAAFEVPSTWKDMKDTENLTVVPVSSGDKEYSDVISKFHQSVGSTRPIIKLERIQNKMLFQQYLAKKKLMDAQNKPGTQNEKELWHGTAPEAVDSINCYGFNRSYCGKNATAFGLGVYFAVNASYSSSNTYSRPDGAGHKRMYLCRVLTGEYTKGNSAFFVPPVKSGVVLYDSVVDNPNGPGMYIIFNDTQGYPDYLITFT